MFARAVAGAVVLVLAAVLLVLAWPSLVGLETVYPVAQAVALRPALAVGAVAAALLLTLLALLARPARRFAAALAVLLLGFAAVNGAVVATRGTGDTAFETPAPGDVTVLAWNTLGLVTGVDAVAALALETGATVVSLPETRREDAESVAQAMAAAGRPMQTLTVAYDQVSSSRSTSLLVSVDLGEYAVDAAAPNTGQIPSVVARPVDGTGPTLMAVHTVAPLRGYMDEWSDRLRVVADLCSASPDVIAAGDFNATIDHIAGFGDSGRLGGCTDAALASGNAAVGTWPTRVPPLLGTPIDHAMAGDAWRVTGFRVVESVDGAGSDHRPVLAQFRRAG